ncbi:zinc transporter ZIP11-like [Watersipora subatra]|uniref:zinc transporter ZIP11-like n=1 Tax=Watersipora subatra TaxID=2589382 RepID=UPI00355C7FE0
MINGLSPFTQTVLGTLFTWGLTAAGAALVFVFSSKKRKVLDGSLGFAAGVMTAASYWSLLAPAIELAEESGVYGTNGQWAFLPVAFGFLLGAAFVWGADQVLPHVGDPAVLLAAQSAQIDQSEEDDTDISIDESEVIPSQSTYIEHQNLIRRNRKGSSFSESLSEAGVPSKEELDIESELHRKQESWQRILLLIIAITLHNIPEGLAVGVGFGAIGKSASATFESARSLAVGIGLQNFPEGLAVSLPLRAAGFSPLKSFWYGQLSGMVEPVAGILGCLAVTLAEPLLPYALAFAAGAMIFVVVDDVIPEAQTCGNGRLASICCIIGFLIMMSMDVGLG